MNTWYIIIFALAILLELSVRIIPTKFNFSAIDKVKEVALILHTLIDAIIPNNKIEK
jgi:hypothetical protein